MYCMWRHLLLFSGWFNRQHVETIDEPTHSVYYLITVINYYKGFTLMQNTDQKNATLIGFTLVIIGIILAADLIQILRYLKRQWARKASTPAEKVTDLKRKTFKDIKLKDKNIVCTICLENLRRKDMVV